MRAAFVFVVPSAACGFFLVSAVRLDFCFYVIAIWTKATTSWRLQGGKNDCNLLFYLTAENFFCFSKCFLKFNFVWGELTGCPPLGCGPDMNPAFNETNKHGCHIPADGLSGPCLERCHICCFSSVIWPNNLRVLNSYRLADRAGTVKTGVPDPFWPCPT